MSSSAAFCQNFVQNAWKKELCSNCFKSKDEHVIPKRPKPKPIALVAAEKVEGIIKKPTQSNTYKKNVNFDSINLTEIIGYGGQDYDEASDEDDNNDSSAEDEDTTSDSDRQEEQDDETSAELKRLTKENTDYNTVNLTSKICEAPLQEDEAKTTSTHHLKLGKPLVDANGRKQTLLVSVTPFGEEVKPIAIGNSNTMRSTPNRLFVKKSVSTFTPPPLKSVVKEPEKETTTTPATVDKAAGDEEKSLLDEIDETLEEKKNIEIVSKRRSPPPPQPQVKSNTADNQPAEPDKLIKPPISERKVCLISRTPALKRDHEKPILKYQTSTAKIELKQPQHRTVRNNWPAKTAPHKSNDGKNEKEFENFDYAALPSKREQPDGRDDPDKGTEPPALPLAPPPVLENIYDKPNPKVAPRPLSLSYGNNITLPSPVALKKDLNERYSPNNNKRKAPKPPMIENNYEIMSIKSTAKPKLLSVSTDNLMNEETNKHRNKIKGVNRFSLKKFLGIGNSKSNLINLNNNLNYSSVDINNCNGDAKPPQAPKPKLVIVHPTDLTGTQVELLPNTNTNIVPATPTTKTGVTHQQKPSPPPRNMDHYNQRTAANPPPPKSREIINYANNRQQNHAYNGNKSETVYANIGEIRKALVPSKPQRSASMREGDNAQSPHYQPQKNDHSAPSHLYSKRSESNIDISGGDFLKYHANINNNSNTTNINGNGINGNSHMPRSMSLTYCGSETESEIYSPYSFYGSESEVAEDDNEWIQIQKGRTHKLRSRKGLSIVHKNLEDNYGAVVVANYEALVQVLENVQQSSCSHIPPTLRGLKLLPSLRWSDFSIITAPNSAITIGQRVLQQALWANQHHVTLMITTGVATSSTRAIPLGTFGLGIITEFSDLIPAKYLKTSTTISSDEELIQANVSVLPWLDINSIQSYGEVLKKQKINDDENSAKDTNFLLLQLINILKILQGHGIEELSLALSNFIICKEVEVESYHQKLCFAQDFDIESPGVQSQTASLCACASHVIKLLPATQITRLLESLLHNEKAVTLTQVKSVLEFWLWGPSDVTLTLDIRERESAIQRWLDLQRATVLHGLVCARVQLTVYEENHLFFLVRSSARMMCDASLLLESTNFGGG